MASEKNMLDLCPALRYAIFHWMGNGNAEEGSCPSVANEFAPEAHRIDYVPCITRFLSRGLAAGTRTLGSSESKKQGR